MGTKNTFIVEVRKALDWEDGYLNWDGNVVTDINEAQEFESEDDAEEAAALFNMEYARNGQTYATVR